MRAASRERRGVARWLRSCHRAPASDRSGVTVGLVARQPDQGSDRDRPHAGAALLGAGVRKNAFRRRLRSRAPERRQIRETVVGRPRQKRSFRRSRQFAAASAARSDCAYPPMPDPAGCKRQWPRDPRSADSTRRARRSSRAVPLRARGYRPPNPRNPAARDKGRAALRYAARILARDTGQKRRLSAAPALHSAVSHERPRVATGVQRRSGRFNDGAGAR